MGILTCIKTQDVFYDKHTKTSIIVHSVYYLFFIAKIILSRNTNQMLYNLVRNESFCNYTVILKTDNWILHCMYHYNNNLIRRKKKISIIFVWWIYHANISWHTFFIIYNDHHCLMQQQPNMQNE